MSASRSLRRFAPLFAGALLATAIAVGALVSRGPHAASPASPRDADAAHRSDVEALEAPSAHAASRRPAQDPARAATATAAAEHVASAAPIRGIVRSRGAPLPGATVELAVDHPAGAWVLPRAPLAVAEAVTDEQGRFALPAGPGIWRVDVRAKDHAPAAARHLPPGADVALDLAPAAALEVRTVDATGRPLAGVELAVHGDFRATGTAVLARATTDAEGQARLAPIANGVHYLVADHRDMRRIHETIDVASGVERVSVRLVLEPGVRLRGRVLGPEGPLAGSSLVLEAFGLGTSTRLDVALADDGGFETDARFFPGERIVAVAAAPERAHTERLVAIPHDIAPGGAHAFEIRLGPAGWSARGRAVDAGGGAVHGADVRHVVIEPLSRGAAGLGYALARVSAHPERWRGDARTSEDASFRIDGLPVDRQVVIAVLSPGHAPRFLWPAGTKAGGARDLGAIVLDRAGAVLVELSRADGTLAADAELSLVREAILDEAQLDEWRPASWWRRHTARAGADGRVRIGGLAPGTYDGFVGDAVVGVITVQAGTEHGPLRWIAPVDERPPRVRIAGSVRDRDGRALRGVFVAAFRDADVAGAPLGMTFSDVAGRYAFDAPAGEPLVLHASDPRGRWRTADERLGALFEPVERDVVLDVDDEEREPLVLFVRATDGSPVEGAVADLEPPQHLWCRCTTFSATSDANGVVVFERLAVGEHTARVRDPKGRYADTVVGGLVGGAHVAVMWE